MSYFLPSFFQKRILRYALSRLELLDTDALDLEKLEIGWGKRSTVELRDVGLHTKKLSSLLSLPRSLAIVSAQILFLRLTIPADLYKSGIVVEVQGVRVHIDADLDEQERAQSVLQKAKRDHLAKIPKVTKVDRPRSNQSHVHDPGGSPPHGAFSTAHEDNGEPSWDLPSTTDLAKSFLQAKTKEEKAALQASVTHSQPLDLSLQSSEAGDIGVGNKLSLPAFLADFLKSVGDRIQIEIYDAEIDLTLRVDRSSNGSQGSEASDRTENVTLRLIAGQILINGTINPKQTPEGSEDTEAQVAATQGTRRVMLSNIEVAVISEASLFADLAKSTAPSSPETLHASSMAKSPSGDRPASNPKHNGDHDPFNNDLDVNLGLGQSQELSSAVLGDRGDRSSRVPPAASAEDGYNQGQYRQHGVSRSEYQESMPAESLYSVRETGRDGHSFLHSEPTQDLDSSHEPRQLRHATRKRRPLGEATFPATSDPFVAASSPAEIMDPPRVLASQTQQSFSIQNVKEPVDPASGYSHPTSSHSSPSPEDLTESKIFTHEEASMYMSAISNTPSRMEDKSNLVPGDWGSSSSGSEERDRPSNTTSQPSKSLRRDDEKSSQPHIPLSDFGQSSYNENAIDDSLGNLRKPQARPLENAVTSSPSADPAELGSFASPPKEGTSSSQGSEVSSANSKTSFTVSKRIVSVDLLVAVIPRGSGIQESPTETRDQWHDNTDQEMPGGFQQAPGVFAAHSLGSSARTSKFDGNHHEAMPYSIDIGEIQLLGDMALTKMMVLVIQQFNAFRRSCPAGTDKHETPKQSKGQEKELKLIVKKINWKFLDAVMGIPLLQYARELPRTSTEFISGGSEILLRSDIGNFGITISKSGTSSNIRISMGKFSFGYRLDDVLSFDSSMKLRESTRDILAPIDDDIILTIKQSHETLKADLTTLPLHVALDLRRLDETFSWFGGFSSMLDLGSSMKSTMIIIDDKSKIAHVGKPKREVRFESSPPSTSLESGSTHSHNKLTARIGGVVFDLQGTQSSLRFESTAMKIVSRTEGLGLQVDRLQLKGFDLKQDSVNPPITVYLTSLRIEYLPVPKEVDLTRLLALLSPSKDKDARDDDILLETLLRQRRQGAVVRATIESLQGNIPNLGDLRYFSLLAEELKKLSTVAKYLPEDDRPGILALVLIKDFRLAVTVNSSFGTADFGGKNVECAHVTFPALMALGLDTLRLYRNSTEELFGSALPVEVGSEHELPAVMARFVGNEMEPTVKIKTHSLRLEYQVSTIMAIMALSDTADTEAVLAEMINSVTTVTSQPPFNVSPPKLSEQSSTSSSDSASHLRTLKLDIVLRDCIIGLNPHRSPAKGLLVLTDTHLLISRPRKEDVNAVLGIQRASIMVIDDVNNISSLANKSTKTKKLDGPKSQIGYLADMGYVSVGSVSAAKATVQVVDSRAGKSKAVDVEIRDDLLVLETCADSTQTLQNILNGLKPPMPPSTEVKYLTEVVSVEDMLASFSGDAFVTTTSSPGNENLPLELDEGDMVDDEVPQNLEFVSSFYNPEPGAAYNGIADSMLEDDLESLAGPSFVHEIGEKNLLESFQDQAQVAPGNVPLQFQEDHFSARSAVQDAAQRWDTRQNTSGATEDCYLDGSPLRCRVRDVHIIWNLYDGYDWQRTRDAISEAVEDVQNRAMDRIAGKDKRKSLDFEDEEQSVIGDFLFNSIYIGIPAKHDPRDLTRQVNQNLDDLFSESGGYATSTSSSSPSRQGHAPRPKSRNLRLNRSRSHKMTFELKGVSADIEVLPPGSGETQSSIDVRIQDLEIFDHVPTSTWKKFATYMHDAGERQTGTSMIHLKMLNVKPVPHLAASEIILKASILPLRLHVDQDALDFMIRFFEFKDDAVATPTPKSELPFLQRVEVNSVRVKLDFKPKRVDYAGIRSGHTTEFMNFFILDRADMVLRHVIIYGVSGFDKLGKTLNDIWMPDIKRNQLPGILAGLAPVRSLVNVGGGVRDLVVVPIREYQKDGRVVRSFQKGAVAFAKTTTSELAKLGAKLAIGTQTVLQGAENLLSQPPVTRSDVSGGWEDAELDAEEKEQISHYADQPVGVIQGLRGGFASLERDLLLAKDAVIAMPGEVLECGTAAGAAKAVLKGAPTVILRPAMGVSKVVGQTLMGATNSLEPENKRRIEEKYKRH